jgi:hypothetical protein
MADADIENAASLIESAGMSVKKRRTFSQRVLAAKCGRTSGTVDLVAPRAGERVSYEWQYSIDEMKTWVSLPVTVKASTSANGFVRGTTVFFRYRTATKDGVGDWSQPTSLLIE